MPPSEVLVRETPSSPSTSSTLPGRATSETLSASRGRRRRHIHRSGAVGWCAAQDRQGTHHAGGPEQRCHRGLAIDGRYYERDDSRHHRRHQRLAGADRGSDCTGHRRRVRGPDRDRAPGSTFALRRRGHQGAAPGRVELQGGSTSPIVRRHGLRWARLQRSRGGTGGSGSGCGCDRHPVLVPRPVTRRGAGRCRRRDSARGRDFALLEGGSGVSRIRADLDHGDQRLSTADHGPLSGPARCFSFRGGGDRCPVRDA